MGGGGGVTSYFLKGIDVILLLRSRYIYTKVLNEREERREVADNFSPSNSANFFFFDLPWEG